MLLFPNCFVAGKYSKIQPHYESVSFKEFLVRELNSY